MAHHPIKQASDIAKLLRLDPIAAGMIKELIPPVELRDLLNIDKSTEEFFEGITNDQFWTELMQRLTSRNHRLEPELIAALKLVKEELL
jgi:hypothetical protein